jgi:tight adherence protein B
MADIVMTWLLSVLLCAALFAVIRWGTPAGRAGYTSVVNRLESELKISLSELFLLDLPTRLLAHLMVFRVPLFMIVGYVLTNSILFTIGFGVLGQFAPKWILAYLKKQRFEKFDEQLLEALNVMASSARAGLNLAQSVESVVSKMPPPASQEFGLLAKEFAFGTPMERVLENARTRLNLPNFSIVATAIIVSRERGGNIVEVLDKINASLREIMRLEKKIKTDTASVRFSAQLMAAMPLAIGIIFYFIEPSSMVLLFTDPVGGVVLFFVVLLNVVAMVIIRRIVNVEI